MDESLDIPPYRPREASSKPAPELGESKLQNKQQTREKQSPVEVVADCPRFRRQMLFTKPFTVYDDVLNADEQKNGKKEDNVPAIHFVLEVTSDGSMLCVGDEEGKKLGWIRKHDNHGYEWNIRSVWKPERNVLGTGHVSVYVRPDRSTGSLEMPVNNKTLLPILEVKRDQAGKVWYKVGPSVGGDIVASNIRDPIWIPGKNDNGLDLRADDGTPNILATKKQIADFERSLRLVVDEWEKSDPGKRYLHIEGLRIAYIRILGGKGTGTPNDDESQRIREFLADHAVAHEILDRDALDRPYQYIDNFKNTLRYFQARLNTIERGDIDDVTRSIQINGKTEKLYPCLIF